MAATTLISGAVTAGAWPASAQEPAHERSEVSAAQTVTVTFPDGSVETFEPEPDASFELPSVQPTAGFSWTATYERRIISREWDDTAGGAVSITTNAISNCGGYAQHLYLMRELVDDNYVAIGEARNASCTNRTVNQWHNIPHTDRYAFMLISSAGTGGRTKTTSGSVSH